MSTHFWGRIGPKLGQNGPENYVFRYLEFSLSDLHQIFWERSWYEKELGRSVLAHLGVTLDSRVTSDTFGICTNLFVVVVVVVVVVYLILGCCSLDTR